VRNRFARLGIAILVVQLGAADNISEKYCDFQVFCHAGFSLLVRVSSVARLVRRPAAVFL
jgi:hypothetical protein